MVMIDEDCLDSFKWFYFGDTENCYKAASNRAYLDMCRTIRFENINGKYVRARVDELIEKEVKKIIDKGVACQDEYDSWHLNICNIIIKEYRQEGILFHIGQAQKWINMTMKYLYIIGDVSMDKIFKYLHIPLDNYVFDVVKKKLKIDKPEKAWSRIDDYDKEYITYQSKIREMIDIEPIRWELKNWIEEAKSRAKMS